MTESDRTPDSQRPTLLAYSAAESARALSISPRHLWALTRDPRCVNVP